MTPAARTAPARPRTPARRRGAPPPVGDGRAPRPARPYAAVLLAAGLALAAGGCGAGAHGATGAPATVEELAAKTGCAKPQMQVDAAELRQAMCKTAKGQYSVTTFATEQGKQKWLEDALDYGGAYLIGTRWIVLGNTEEMLESFRGQLGGTVRRGGHVMPQDGATPGGPPPQHSGNHTQHHSG
ncbi:hypothetical protein [Sphaerisporangium sp. TRM90804]|uniref:hypothetical protein n=1 Tax=Sphaerisporangium sp. TRM90804 TaxID=3031113 RepID=UPI00244C76EB|nr:hypothetical protein [Sphaerisporangium sp. TRM90804]MDH2427154.1 hypothetical protein [Sphaerisporangium sp. TRM90804]